ncbi:branched-chain amino acid ABC transporter permease [Microbacterium sp. VKM Ac-2923]|uniref:branched-chain amino acid ABC transporter permease n=1 Tax=Microbacterium sp. VKM Ac-2923 TaxID=2929476 RepID=UPI001FB1E77D|nr:branched-chain amino acid ABC transporter permease [Microbacterium sp. VKM Ac-2923]MCJ1706461.1 branched-chain amino acid ABC transporter permease [Microbacterium sp. VKM Ac-2923]
MPRRRRSILTLLSGFFAAALVFGLAPSSVAAVNDEDLPYSINVNVRSEGEPVAQAKVTATDGTFTGEGTTDERGRATIKVPTKDGAWTLELDQSSLTGISVPDGQEFERTVEFGSSSTVSSNFTLGAAERQTTSFLDQLLSRTVNGLNFGLMLALAAIGLSLVFGTTGLSNFAHGEMVTFGAIAALFLSAGTGWSVWVAIPLAIILSGLFGLAMDAGIWRPLRRRGLGIVQLMIVSIGLSLALRYVFQIFIGGGTQQLPGASSEIIPGLGPVRISITDVTSMAISIIVIGAFAWWLTRTRLGRATRAVSDNPSLAAASGIDVDNVVRIVWVLASALAGLAGVLWAYFRPGIRWDMGSGILLLMFAAVVLGGLGTAFGALIGSIIVGLLVEVSTLWIPSDMKYVGALVVLIVILLFRPQGILGRRERIG